MAPSASFEQWVVPIFDGDGEVRGTGWLVTSTAVVTCEHVVTETGYTPEDPSALELAGCTVTEIELDEARDPP